MRMRMRMRMRRYHHHERERAPNRNKNKTIDTKATKKYIKRHAKNQTHTKKYTCRENEQERGNEANDNNNNMGRTWTATATATDEIRRAESKWTSSTASRFAAATLAATAMTFATTPAASVFAADAAKVGTCVITSCTVSLARCIADVPCLENLACLQSCAGRPDEGDCQVRCSDLYADKVRMHTCIPYGRSALSSSFSPSCVCSWVGVMCVNESFQFMDANS